MPRQTNVHLFRTRKEGKYAGMPEGQAQWLETLDVYYKDVIQHKARKNQEEEARRAKNGNSTTH